jgi:UDP-2,3-diacylglucosamine pyrophosphatase LpxH
MLLFAERYVSREGIYVEHGHQYAEKLSRWEDFDDPCDPANPDQLIYPVGSLFMIDFINFVERDRAWADGLKPLTALVWCSLEWDFSFAARMLLALARYVPGIGIGTGGQAHPSLDALCQQLSDEAICRSLSERYRSLAEFRRDFHMQVGRLLVPAASPPGMFLWPLSPDDETASKIAQTEIHEIEASMRRVATRLAETQGARVIVFGHTHRPHLELLNEHTTWINCGTWQWLGGYDPVQADVWKELFDHPRRIPPRHRLTYARIDYDEQDRPHAQLNVWAEPQKELPRGNSHRLGHILDRLRRGWGEV